MNAKTWHSEPYIVAAALYGFGDVVQPRGGDPVALLERVGIDPAALSDPDMLVSFPRVGMAMELAAAELGAPSLGLEWALSIPPHFPNVGPVVFIAQLVSTLKEWIEQGARYWRAHTDGYMVHLIDDGVSDRVSLRYWQSPLISPPRQQTELTLGNACNMARIVTGQPDESPACVRFRHHRPKDTTVHDMLFRCALEFDAEHNEIVFERKYLDLPTRGRLKPLKALADSFIRSRIRNMPLYNQSIRTTTEVTIQCVLGTGKCSKEFVAESMGVNPRKLHRLLEKAGTSFGELLDDTRKALACRLLAQTGVPISAVAGLLEYSSTTALNLAMKRWTGMTTSEYRARAGIESQAGRPVEAAGEGWGGRVGHAPRESAM